MKFNRKQHDRIKKMIADMDEYGAIKIEHLTAREAVESLVYLLGVLDDRTKGD